jgi:hypothetical protein
MGAPPRRLIGRGPQLPRLRCLRNSLPNVLFFVGIVSFPHGDCLYRNGLHLAGNICATDDAPHDSSSAKRKLLRRKSRDN